MKKIGLGILIAVVIAVLAVSVALALPTNKGIDKTKEASPAINEETGNVIAPPEFAPVPFPQLPESELTKIVFIRYAPGFPVVRPAKPACGDDVVHPSEQCGELGLPECPAGSVCINCKCVVEEEVAPTACYAFLSGAKPKWNWVEDYYYESGLEASNWATATWDAETTATIFGAGVSGTFPWGVYDYKNSISFGAYSEEGVIAVTAIWFRAKNIYEYDIMFDTDYFPGTIDLPTVTLHEFGHGAGLNDLYDSVCLGNVMYGHYEGVKTTLGNGDITGIQTLYGF